MTTQTVASTACDRALLAVDCCDRCGARAYVLAFLAGLELTFCVHHGRASIPALLDKGATVYNHSKELADLVTPSARDDER